MKSRGKNNLVALAFSLLILAPTGLSFAGGAELPPSVRDWMVAAGLRWGQETATPKIGEILAQSRHGWGESIGWVDFSPRERGLRVGANILSGWIKTATLGWICLGRGEPADGLQYANRSDRDFGVNNDGRGNLSGWAWSAAAGWISFAGVRIERNGDFSGYAHSKNTGRIGFRSGKDDGTLVKTDPYPWAEIGGKESIRAGGGSGPFGAENLISGWEISSPAIPIRSVGPELELAGEAPPEPGEDGYYMKSGGSGMSFSRPEKQVFSRGPPGGIIASAIFSWSAPKTPRWLVCLSSPVI